MANDIKCPECGSSTRLRTSKKDDSKFYVCVNWPECRGKVAFDDDWEDEWDEARPIKPTRRTTASGMIYCHGCGAQIHKSARACPHCGAVIKADEAKSKVTFGILALFLGGLGVHRFYLGQAIGIAYLLFCWTGIPSIVALIEGIIALCSSDEAWERKLG